MSKLCRICLAENITKDIFSLPYELNVQDTPYEVMEFCLDIELCEDTKQHNALCNQCHSLIKQFYKFKLLALKTEQHLRCIKECKNDDNSTVTNETEIILLDDVIVKFENEIKVEPQFSLGLGDDDLYEPECDDEVKEQSCGEENVAQFEDTGTALPNKNIGRRKRQKEECQICGKKFTYLKLHMLMHTKPEKITCKACKESFSNVTTLDQHYQEIHKDWEQCKVCNKYILAITLIKHTKRYHKKGPKTLACEFCQKLFANSCGLEKHLPRHLKEKRFYCNDCDKSFYGELGIELHIRRDHMKERFFKCPKCDKTFHTKSHMEIHCLKHAADYKRTKEECPICGKAFKQLYQHMRRHQSAESRQKNQCSVCNKMFVSSSYVKRHFNAVHLKKTLPCPICQKDVQRLGVHMTREHSAKQFACEKCPKTFAVRSLLKQHLISHSTERPYECEECGVRFKEKEWLKRHITNIHIGEQKFLCQICSKTFARKCNLTEHLLSHTTERKFKCEVCKKMFKSAECLRVHMLRHEGVEKYFCKICDRGFIVSGALRSHMLSHTKEKRYQCRLCDARFGRSDHRTRHEKTAHSFHKDKQTSVGE